MDSYESAKLEKIPFSGKKKETEIIALRIKNEELHRRNERLFKDNGFLHDELKAREKAAQVNESATKLIKKLIEYAPEEFDTAKQAAEYNRQKKSEKFRSKTSNDYNGK